jgi:hypothetical protein
MEHNADKTTRTASRTRPFLRFSVVDAVQISVATARLNVVDRQ